MFQVAMFSVSSIFDEGTWLRSIRLCNASNPLAISSETFPWNIPAESKEPPPSKPSQNRQQECRVHRGTIKVSHRWPRSGRRLAAPYGSAQTTAFPCCDTSEHL